MAKDPSIQAATALAQGEYDQAIALYEQLVDQLPDEKANYWSLGLAYLLGGDASAAQLTWAWALQDGTGEEIAPETAALMQVLQTAAVQQETAANFANAWLIRQQMRAIDATDLADQIEYWRLAVQLGEASLEELRDELAEPLRSLEPAQLEPEPLLRLLSAILEASLFSPALAELMQSCRRLIELDSFVQILRQRAEYVGYTARNYGLACRYAELGLQLNPTQPQLRSFLAYFYGLEGSYEQAIALAQETYETAQSLTEQLTAHSLLLRSLIKAGGNWQAAIQRFAHQQQLLSAWLETPLDPAQPPDFALFTSACYYFPYLADAPEISRPLQNRAARRCQQQMDAFLNHHGIQRLSNPTVRSHRPLRIAYLSAGLRQHSIGWLARWVMQYHDRDRVEVYLYLRQQAEISDFTQRWYVERATCARCLSGSPLEMAQTITMDEIDILIDLDSLTSDHACQIMALKPAPIQVSWLGWDASGIPNIDYFIVDPYVVPDNAQAYYAETLWVMPDTYIAVDGFEIGTPTLRRDQLGIPGDAVVYFSSQAAFKRHPDTIRLQMQILKAVPNSYFLIKGLGDEAQVRQLFFQIAVEEGVAVERLRFLPITDQEETHRANLAIADVVLDTFPYNGATTTMETLWMGIPIVTRVGQQFSARNSYGMMTNAGLNAGMNAGIAWDDQQYIEWGVRLGSDAALRQQVAWQLRQSRHTAPLWNAKQFTQNLETAYEQMWRKR
jgi:predicted O-linked N-acetylglucosamine transferase (SPINDLY family)